MRSAIHPSAVIEEGAVLAAGVEVGPFCHVGPRVKLGEGVRLLSHVALVGNTTVGARSRIFPFASVGHEPQDLKYKGEETTLDIGENCIIREGVTMNPGTAGDKRKTIIGNNCVFLANSHVAHDCVIGNNVIFSNAVLIAGHCKIGNNVILGGGAGVHQFCRIGNNSFVGGMAGLENDVIPYGIALGNRAYLGGLNLIGMKRAAIKRESIHNARAAFKFIFSGELHIAEAVNGLPDNLKADPVVAEIVAFIKNCEDRSLCTPRSKEDLG